MKKILRLSSTHSPRLVMIGRSMSIEVQTVIGISSFT